MKVIDLLNKIANGEEVPNKIKWKDELFNDDVAYFLYEYIGDCSNRDIKLKLNCNVDIIEEPQKHKLPRKIDYTFNLGFIDINDKDLVIKELNNTVNNLYEKYNEIIDYLEKIE